MNIVNTSNVDHYKWGKDCDGWHLLRSQGLSVIEERVPPGEKEERHCHTESQQFFYILSGTAQLEGMGPYLIFALEMVCMFRRGFPTS